MMGTVGKAIFLLDLFTAREPELGLSELARRSGFDKATTRRLLVSLSQNGFVEQDVENRRYRLGAGISRLARIREAHFPFLQISTPAARELSLQTGETVHLSEFSAGALATVHVEQSTRANRVNVDIGQILPLHGTASGIAFLAFSRPELVKSYVGNPLVAFTSHTITDRTEVMAAVRAAAVRGYSQSSQGYEDGVFSVAAPILGPDGYAIGTLSVASPLSRIDDGVAARHGEVVMDVCRQISLSLNGEPVGARLNLAS